MGGLPCRKGCEAATWRILISLSHRLGQDAGHSSEPASVPWLQARAICPKELVDLTDHVLGKKPGQTGPGISAQTCRHAASASWTSVAAELIA